MKIVMTLLVRDEEDILADNINFHLSRGVDHIIAMDNRSEDRTAEILISYQAAGVLTYIFQPDDDYSQSDWVTDMAQQAYRELNADWVINNDADEFWWPEFGDLKDVLDTVPSHVEAVQVERSNFILPPPGDHRPFATTMIIRERQSLNGVGHPLPPKTCHRGFSDVIVRQGNHEVVRQGKSLSTTSAPINILHFPVRSFQQLSNKIAKGGAAYRRNTTLPEEVGATWRKLHDLQERGQLQAEFDALVLSADEVAAGLAEGRLLRDERLRNALAELMPT